MGKPFTCEFCSRPCTAKHHYRFGGVGGFLCTGCARGLQTLVTQWAGIRGAELAQEIEARTEPEKPSPRVPENHPRGFRRAG